MTTTVTVSSVFTRMAGAAVNHALLQLLAPLIADGSSASMRHCCISWRAARMVGSSDVVVVETTVRRAPDSASDTPKIAPNGAHLAAALYRLQTANVDGDTYAEVAANEQH